MHLNDTKKNYNKGRNLICIHSTNPKLKQYTNIPLLNCPSKFHFLLVCYSHDAEIVFVFHSSLRPNHVVIRQKQSPHKALRNDRIIRINFKNKQNVKKGSYIL